MNARILTNPTERLRAAPRTCQVPFRFWRAI